ncbi:hypothetical protein LY71_113131 [Geodermatophilus tzadiensis]|uniref:Uncharacterized protein n=1 Tax=Geodermatophilus tzadiensis TaxID=1137988 RepID=A0A2T0TPS4_9ACTN|nr:hypothetical protein [Geodermatophilus tzadiensis]PRY47629.1 hypothetical protein LY71_113131 [Geodermatophilus tzadiensis]
MLSSSQPQQGPSGGGEVAAPAPVPDGQSTQPGPTEPQQTAAPGRPQVQDGGDSTRRQGADRSTAADTEAADAVPQALTTVGAIIAPTTLLTALFTYFGLLYAVAYYRYFGINYTVLDLPIQGFLILSASTATLPLALIAAATLLALGVYRLPLQSLSRRARSIVLYGILPIVATVGVALLGLVVTDALFAARAFPAGLWEARGLSLSGGVVLLAYCARLWRAVRPRSAQRPHSSALATITVAKWTCVTVLFGVGLFWAVGSYAIRVGEHGAQALVAVLRCAPDVVLYSEKSLNLQSAGVQEEQAPSAGGAYGFRYTGLKLVPQAGDHYLLLPADWAPGARPAILLPRSDTLRLEFVPVAGTHPRAC